MAGGTGTLSDGFRELGVLGPGASTVSNLLSRVYLKFRLFLLSARRLQFGPGKICCERSFLVNSCKCRILLLTQLRLLRLDSN